MRNRDRLVRMAMAMGVTAGAVTGGCFVAETYPGDASSAGSVGGASGAGAAGSAGLGSGGGCTGPACLCDDGAQDGAETGVDCGGACPACGGSPCHIDATCKSGHCADGVCCDAACTGHCEACTYLLSGQEDGLCGPVLFGVVDGAECGGLGGCGLAGKCACEDGGQDISHPAQGCPSGTACTFDSTCASARCRIGTCCPQDTVCDECHQCGPGGACAPVRLSSDGACESGKTCSAELACKKKNGEGCLAGLDCASKRCVSLLCAACATDNDCAANDVSKGGEGSSLCSGGWCKRPLHAPCETDLACATDRCVNGACQACEADDDCASHACDKSAGRCRFDAGEPCAAGTDCAGGVCEGGACAPT